MEQTVQTPKKTYYSISEVCTLTALEPHVLRYWESEFPQLRPKKNRAGNRAYRDKDIEIIEYIKRLLYEEKYTIPGARKKLLETKDLDTKEAEPREPIQEALPLSPLPAAPRAGRPAAAVRTEAPEDRGTRDNTWVVEELKSVLKLLQG